MPASLALTTPVHPRPGSVRASLEARLAVYPAGLEPPVVEHLVEPDGAALVERLFCRSAAVARVPVLALREVIENLAHARFDGALVSVLDGGCTVRVSDRGPGIADPARALEAGFTTADPEARRVIRGVGGGLPLAHAVMADRGGRLDLADNLGAGTVATLSLPRQAAEEPAADVGEAGRRLLALLVELAPASPERLAAELAVPLADCGRELILLEHRGLVSRDPDGERTLSERGAALVATLF